MRLLFYLFILSQFLNVFAVFADKDKKRTIEHNQIKWEKVQENKSNKLQKIIWKSYNGDKIYFENEDREVSSDKKIINIKDKNKSDAEKNKNFKITELDSYLPLNNYPRKKEFNAKIQLKSAFSGGSGGGTGHQNLSARFDYGLNEDSLLSIYLSESDDPLFNKINGKIIQNTWSVFAIGFKKKLFESNDLRNSISFASSIEYWIITSGKDGPNFSKSMFNAIDDTLGFERYPEFIYSFSLPYNRNINEKTTFIFVPGFISLPDFIGNKHNNKSNFYGNSVYLGSGLKFDISKDFNLFGAYTYLLGPGNNHFNHNLAFSRKSIYSYGFNWNINPIIGIEGKITNGYGGTPATGLLTIPSANESLYYVGASYRPSQKDTNLKPLLEKNEALLHGGLTVENAFLPYRGKSQLSFNYDSLGSLFSSYKYSLSNIFQLQLISGNYQGINLSTKNNIDLRNTYLNKYNFNYRVGGKILFLSPQKNDLFWLSSRVSLGRDLHSRQGYSFLDLTSTFRINDRLTLNISPKYLFSGVDNLAALGISNYTNLSQKLLFISETNIGLNENSECNLTFSLRHLQNKDRAIDFYVSNAVGIEDLGQLLRSDNYKFGIKMSFIF
tara:strand:- start:1580 stop:3412 length:1833 start_codon:yes stop_codon:yes gene_type:complete